MYEQGVFGMKNKILGAVMAILMMALPQTVSAATIEILGVDRSSTVQNSLSDGEYFTATFYGGGGITALGNSVYEGCCAVDPSVIPLGSTVYIVFPPGYSWLSGNYFCCDTGGAVYGNVVDIYLDLSEEELNNLGVVSVIVYR